MASLAQGPNAHKGKSVLLVEPDDVIRQSLLDWLGSAMPECRVMGTASTQEAMALPRFEPPSVAVVDIADPDVDGADAIRSTKGAMRRTHIVALTMSDHSEYCETLACAGASASLLIWETQCKLVPLIRAILAADRGAATHANGLNHVTGDGYA